MLSFRKLMGQRKYYTPGLSGNTDQTVSLRHLYVWICLLTSHSNTKEEDGRTQLNEFDIWLIFNWTLKIYLYRAKIHLHAVKYIWLSAAPPVINNQQRKVKTVSYESLKSSRKQKQDFHYVTILVSRFSQACAEIPC